MRIELFVSFACLVLVSACGANVSAPDIGAVGAGSLRSSSWTSDPAQPQGRSRANTVDTGVPGTDCRDAARTETVAGQVLVMSGTSCTLKKEAF